MQEQRPTSRAAKGAKITFWRNRAVLVRHRDHHHTCKVY